MTDPTPPSLKQLRIQRNAPGAPRRRRWGLWIGAAVAVLAVGAFVLRPGKIEVQVTSVVTTYPSQQYAQLTASGYVVAQRRAAVASKATGRLEVLNVREGSLVKQGDVLARLDASDVRAALAQAQAAVRQAEAAVAQAGVERAQAEADLKRQQALQAKGFVSPQTVETATTRVNAAQAAVATAEAAAAVARAQVKVQQVNLEYTEIRAPFDGVVLVKNANVGDMITPFSQAANSQGAVVTMTTIAMDAIPREKMGYATSLFSLMRNMGGSIGIAVTSTLLARHTQQATSLYGANVTTLDPTSQSLFYQMRGAFMAGGADIVTATDRTYAALFGMVQRQAAMVSFVGLFQLLGIVFIVVTPLVLLMKRPRASAGGAGAAAH